MRNNNRSEKRISLKCVTWMFIIVLVVLAFGFFLGKTAEENMKILDELHETEKSFVKFAQEDYYGNEYKFSLTNNYLVELFPYGVTDNDRYRPDYRLMKVTWYDKKGIITDTDYRVIPFKQ